MSNVMYGISARYYDKMYSFKDYRAEVERLLSFIFRHRPVESGRLLDVACGTGRHLEFLSETFRVEGLDLSSVMLDAARLRLPETPFHLGDMVDFELDHRFDVITCLFSSIGYVGAVDNLHRAVSCMARHLEPGGVLAIEPWFTPEAWNPGTVHALLIDEPELKIARVSTSFAEGHLSYFDMHYLVGTPDGTEHCVERHEMGLFEVEEVRDAFLGAGLEASFDPEGLIGRGLHLGFAGG